MARLAHSSPVLRYFQPPPLQSYSGLTLFRASAALIYHGFGNLTAQTKIKGSAPAYSASYNPATNQQYSDCADANGNVFGLASCAGANAYSYDAENRLTAPANAGGMHYSFDSANATGDVVGFFRHIGRDVIRGNLGTPCLHSPWSNP